MVQVYLPLGIQVFFSEKCCQSNYDYILADFLVLEFFLESSVTLLPGASPRLSGSFDAAVLGDATGLEMQLEEPSTGAPVWVLLP